MLNMKLRKMQIPLIAVAALAMFAMAAALLLAGDAQAHATVTTIAAEGGDNNPLPQQGQSATATPTPPPHATPEACPAEGQAASVIDEGQYALFDVWWNDVEKELTNTVCPPSVVHVPEQPAVPPSFGNPGKPAVPASDTRTASNINITADPPTIIHIPSSAKVDLSTSTTYTKTNYPQLWAADNKENRDTNDDGTPDGVGDGMVWVLPACPTDGSTFNGLCLSFSAALLNSDDWAANKNIEYHLDHVHQIDIDRQDPRYTLAYDIPAGGATGELEAIWDSADAQVAVMKVAPGEYDRPTWFFTSRGTYELQVHIQGYPNTGNSDPISKDDSVTSDQRMYILHVGAEADLSATMTVTPESPSPTNDVTITITASNAGPDTAPSTKVDVVLPEGLTYKSHEPTTVDYDSATGVWNIGELAVTNDDNTATNDDSPTLTIKATVDAGTHGKALTAKATISATETVEITETVKNEQGNDEEEVVEYPVAVVDKTPGNNMPTGTVTVASSANVNPMFFVGRSVPENSAGGTNVGTPVLVKDTEDILNLTFTLSGEGHRNFRISHADDGAQIKVAANAYLNYEDTTAPYNLMLHVSDGKDSNGNDDSDSVDDTIMVRIAVTDVAEPVALTVTATPETERVNLDVRLQASLGPNPPAEKSEMSFIWLRRPLNGEIDEYWRVEGNHSYDDILVTSTSAGVMQYMAIGKYLDNDAGVYKTVESDWKSVTYTD